MFSISFSNFWVTLESFSLLVFSFDCRKKFNRIFGIDSNSFILFQSFPPSYFLNCLDYCRSSNSFLSWGPFLDFRLWRLPVFFWLLRPSFWFFWFLRSSFSLFLNVTPSPSFFRLWRPFPFFGCGGSPFLFFGCGALLFFFVAASPFSSVVAASPFSSVVAASPFSIFSR